MTRHVLVTEPDALAGAVAGLRQEGACVRENFVLPDEPWDVSAQRLVCFGEVRDLGDARSAVLCAARGARLLLAVQGDSLLGPLLEDLRRLGEVTRLEPEPVPDPQASLAEDQLALLRLLGAGASVPAAARQLFLSQRTAERRLAAARQQLGVATTAQALVAVEQSERRAGGP